MNSCKIKTFLFSFSLLLSLPIFSQPDFREAYLLLTERDTLFGYINNNDYTTNAHYVEFRFPGKDSTERYYPGSIFGYRFINGKYYVSKQIAENEIERDYFFEFLVHGELDIYFLQDEGYVNRYFASNSTSGLTELKYLKEVQKIDNKDIMVEKKYHQGILNYLTYGHPEAAKSINQISKPDHKSLISFARYYNEDICDGGECVIYEKRMPNAIYLDAMSGVGVSLVNVAENDLSPMGVYQLHLNYQAPFFNERTYFGVGLISYLDAERAFLALPFTLSYIHQKEGFSPLFRYGISLHTTGVSQLLEAGLKYQKKRFSLIYGTELIMIMPIKPLLSSQKLGIMVRLN